MATFTSNHEIGETVVLPDGKTGTITSVTFTTPSNPVYHIDIPEHTETIPASTEDNQLDG